MEKGGVAARPRLQSCDRAPAASGPFTNRAESLLHPTMWQTESAVVPRWEGSKHPKNHPSESLRATRPVGKLNARVAEDVGAAPTVSRRRADCSAPLRYFQGRSRAPAGAVQTDACVALKRRRSTTVQPPPKQPARDASPRRGLPRSRRVGRDSGGVVRRRSAWSGASARERS